MSRRARLRVLLCAALAWPVGACQPGGERSPPPDARRPIIKTQAELSAEREERIRSGRVVPTSAPARLTAARSAPAKLAFPAPIQPSPGAIEAEILLVDDGVLTLPEILYPLREQLAEARRTQTREGFGEVAQRMLRIRVQQEIGALLIHQEATRELSDPQLAVVADAVERQVQGRIGQEFGGSSARFEKHLAEHGLTLEQYRAQLERGLVARQYTREKLLPKVSVRRGELLAHYRRNIARYSSEETRELAMIEAPFEAFLPPTVPWAQAPPNLRAQAKIQAARHIRAAHAALDERPFDEVAREYSHGVHAAQGGTWGEIGRPLQPPYDKLSAVVFELQEGRHSEPLEGLRGWYIVRCGRIIPAKQESFTEAQEEIRQRLIERKFEKLSARYMIQLAGSATVSSLDSFLRTAMKRVLAEESHDEPSR